MTDAPTATIIRKLRTSIADCSPHGVARPLWVQDVWDIIQLIEALQKQVDAIKQPESSDTVAYVAKVPVSRAQAAALGVDDIALGEVGEPFSRRKPK